MQAYDMLYGPINQFNSFLIVLGLTHCQCLEECVQQCAAPHFSVTFVHISVRREGDGAAS